MIRARTSIFVFVALLLLLLQSSTELFAQAAQPTPPPPEPPRFRMLPGWNHVTLQGYELQTRRFLMNRYTSYLGHITDRGVFNMFTPHMREEYDLDELTMQFTPQDDYMWFYSPNGFRMAATDLNKERLYTYSHFRTDVEIKKKHHITVDGVYEDNLRMQGLYLNVGYRYNIWGNHHIGLEHTLGGFKADLDINAFYMWGNQQFGMLRIDVTGLDYLNNFVFNDVYGSSSRVDTLRKYNNLPFLYQVKVLSPQLKNYRVELIYGHMPEYSSSVRSQVSAANEFSQWDFSTYAAALFEFTYDFITTGLIFQNRIAKMTRDQLSPTSTQVQYVSNQRDYRYGAFLLVTGYQARFESWVWYNTFNDNQDGPGMFSISTFGEPFLFKEARLIVRNRFQYRPNHRGFIFGLEHFLDSRDVTTGIDEMRSYSPSVHDLNSRLIGLVGYQFHPRCILTLGAGYDLDGDLYRKATVNRLDNVFGRFEIRW